MLLHYQFEFWNHLLLRDADTNVLNSHCVRVEDFFTEALN